MNQILIYSISNPAEKVKKDSDGKQLSEQQIAYFKDSKVRDKDGNLLVMYHQTDSDFTVFNTDNQKAGKFDSEMPTGIFLKPTEKDIGLSGKKQMKLYVNITNPIHFNSREDAVKYFEKNVQGYKNALNEIAEIDREYQQKYDEADIKTIIRLLIMITRLQIFLIHSDGQKHSRGLNPSLISGLRM